MSLDLRIFRFCFCKFQSYNNYMFYLLFVNGHELAWFSLGDDKNAVLMHFGVKTQIRPKWNYVVYDLNGSMGPGAKPRSWVMLTCDIRKGIKRV